VWLFYTAGRPDRFQISIFGPVVGHKEGSQQVRVLDQFEWDLAVAQSNSSGELSIVFSVDRKKQPRIMVLQFEVELPVSARKLGTGPDALQFGFGLRSWSMAGLP
jgi:hypothetical protein